ncbi:hypothetical protein [Nostoc sp.]
MCQFLTNTYKPIYMVRLG